MRGNPERIQAMARALFKSWFVDFHRVIDNALRAASPMPHELADRAGARREALDAGNPIEEVIDGCTRRGAGRA